MNKRIDNPNLVDHFNKKKRCGINIIDFPKMLIIYLSNFLQLESILHFSSTNKKFQEIFSEFRVIWKDLKELGFLSNYFSKNEDNEERKSKLKEIIWKKNFKELEDRSGNTPLFYHCEKEIITFDKIKFYIENKSNLDYPIKRKSPLNLLCKNKNVTLKIVKYMVENKAEITVKENKEEFHPVTPLIFAVLNGISIEIIKYLIDCKSQLSIPSFIKDSVLHRACNTENISLEVIKCLIENKSDVKKKFFCF
jgi:hypothetical protein